MQERKLHGVDYQRVHPQPRTNNFNPESRRGLSHQVSGDYLNRGSVFFSMYAICGGLFCGNLLQLKLVG